MTHRTDIILWTLLAVINLTGYTHTILDSSRTIAFRTLILSYTSQTIFHLAEYANRVVRGAEGVVDCTHITLIYWIALTTTHNLAEDTISFVLVEGVVASTRWAYLRFHTLSAAIDGTIHARSIRVAQGKVLSTNLTAVSGVSFALATVADIAR